ncbi:UDP-glucose 4-epimerase GalE [Cupriavidus gilardii]|uniref:UDP-glucose 4-epimerase n=1 Tax=Cupriavidus gilardii TaxID=82541 RepID=A0ABY4VHG2_9BURK|nr:UDP-glucose 4-epimerase GalE [Cupriavidus gilardii]MCT9071376.1 UDP-glucose 4-epimerase GalE [Cupriavidus gilardii]MCT9073221.1 UDP-glucose 4-epimerase GalE [Cupriavidus gilardii]MCT9119203.1 UDP-glucose 4-epimerase GalE [Cupriavidus gilardii]QKS60734.1 UDP-glucose 4-epimerase GalE [Cupriavidus gilardii]USE76667.1 UDP-glucose 4-epimerase GalE [Cupriavidus gilardii]
MPDTLLLTGATGYIASHTWVALLAAGYDVVGLDNLSNSNRAVVDRIATISGQTPRFVEGDVRDRALLDRVFAEHRIAGAIHFAALKAVGESVAQPLAYYDNNLNGLLTLCAAMQAAGVKTLVFSSSATVYGNPHAVPIREEFPLSATNPYGQTKLMGEQILRDLERADPHWRIAYLRYFNPVGAHESGLIGEDPGGVPNNLMPYVAQVAAGRRERLMVFGGDYPTADGTGVRDYIHVCDLADGHLAALRYLNERGEGMTVNLGTGRGYSVLEVVEAYRRASGKPIPYEIVARRPGDIASCYADPALAQRLLGWQARHDLDRMCADSWRWQSMNPLGFAS